MDDRIFKKSMACGLIVVFVFCLFVSPKTSAQNSISKEEVVYGILNSDGTVKEVVVVNSFDVNSATQLVDYTSGYSSVTNLTNGEEITANGDTVKTTATEAGRFSYSGVLENTWLPWIVDVEYRLNGSETEPETLYNKSGKLEIIVNVAKNTAIEDDYFDTLAVQMTATFDANKTGGITGDKLTVSSGGGSRTASYIFMPGEGGTASLSLDIKDFAFSGIQFAAVPLSVDIEDSFDVSSIAGDLSSELLDLENGIHELSDGIDDISDGTRVMTDGMIKFNEGLKQARDGANLYYEGVAEFNTQTGLLLQAVQLTIDTTLLQAQPIVVAVNGALTLAGQPTLPALTESNYKTVLESLLNAQPGTVVGGIVGGMMAADPTLAANITQIIGMLDYNTGIKAYMYGAKELASGSLQITSSIPEMSKNFDLMTSGAASLLGGVELYQNGVNRMSDEVFGMGSQVEDEINETIETETESFTAEFVPKSFVSNKNKNVEALQFILKTESIEEGSLKTDTTNSDEADEGETVTQPSIMDRVRELIDLMFVEGQGV